MLRVRAARGFTLLELMIVMVLLAVLGYAVGTVGAVICMELMRYLSGGG